MKLYLKSAPARAGMLQKAMRSKDCPSIAMTETWTDDTGRDIPVLYFPRDDKRVPITQSAYLHISMFVKLHSGMVTTTHRTEGNKQIITLTGSDPKSGKDNVLTVISDDDKV